MTNEEVKRKLEQAEKDKKDVIKKLDQTIKKLEGELFDPKVGEKWTHKFDDSWIYMFTSDKKWVIVAGPSSIGQTYSKDILKHGFRRV